MQYKLPTHRIPDMQ